MITLTEEIVDSSYCNSFSSFIIEAVGAEMGLERPNSMVDYPNLEASYWLTDLPNCYLVFDYC